MVRKVSMALAVCGLLCVAGIAQAQEDYLDVETVRVRPEKRAEFDAVCKKMVAANRKNKGDTWIAAESTYGEGFVVIFISFRHSYAEAEQGLNAFGGALAKSYGESGADKIAQEFNNTVSAMRIEFRRRRYDLSANASSDPAATAKMLGETRWIRTTTVHVRPGHNERFEAQLKDLKEALESNAKNWTLLVSNTIVGGHGTVYYVSTLASSFAGYDALPQIGKVLGEDGLHRFFESSADSVESTDSAIYHILPELSNPPEAVVAVAPDFWNPKPVAKPAAAKTTKPEEKK